MNWPLFWALLLAFGVVISNILLIKHLANLKLPPAKFHPGGNKTNKERQKVQTESTPHPARRDQRQNTPE